MLRVTSPEEPPPVSPVPAFTAVMSPTCPFIVTEPFEPVTMEMPLPAMRYDVPSASLVREPLMLGTVRVSVVLL